MKSAILSSMVDNDGWVTEDGWLPEKQVVMVVRCVAVLDDECSYVGEANVTLTRYEETTEYTFECPSCGTEEFFTRMDDLEGLNGEPPENRTPDLSANWWEFNCGNGTYIPLNEEDTSSPQPDPIQRSFGDSTILN